jgi:hypothetical protein
VNIFKLGFSMALATAASALIEDWLTGKKPSPAWAVLAIAAMVVMGWFWVEQRRSSARHGCFVHVVCEPQTHLARHAAEHVVLQTWVSEQWPDAPVLPFQPEVGSRHYAGHSSSDEQLFTQRLSRRAIRQIQVARDFGPGIPKAVVLPAGPEHRMVVVGAAHGCRFGPAEVTMLSDNATPDGQPFVEFDIPEPGLRGGGYRRPGVTTLSLPGINLDQAALKPFDPIQVGEPGKLDTKNQLEARLSMLASTLKEVETTQVRILTSAPAAVAFAAGFVAARMGFEVLSLPYVRISEDEGRYLHDYPVRTPHPLPPGRPDLQRRRSRWRWHLGTSAVLLSICATTLAATLGLGIEQFVKDVWTPESVTYWGQWAMLATVAAIGSVAAWAWNRWVLVAPPAWLPALQPRLTIALGDKPSGERLGNRLSPVAHACVGAEAAAELTESFCAALTTLPSAIKWNVQLDGAGSAAEAGPILTSDKFGLDRTLRARTLVKVEYRGKVEYARPRGKDEAKRVFGQPEPAPDQVEESP